MEHKVLYGFVLALFFVMPSYAKPFNVSAEAIEPSFTWSIVHADPQYVVKDVSYDRNSKEYVFDVESKFESIPVSLLVNARGDKFALGSTVLDKNIGTKYNPVYRQKFRRQTIIDGIKVATKKDNTTIVKTFDKDTTRFKVGFNSTVVEINETANWWSSQYDRRFPINISDPYDNFDRTNEYYYNTFLFSNSSISSDNMIDCVNMVLVENNTTHAWDLPSQSFDFLNTLPTKSIEFTAIGNWSKGETKNLYMYYSTVSSCPSQNYNLDLSYSSSPFEISSSKLFINFTSDNYTDVVYNRDYSNSTDVAVTSTLYGENRSDWLDGGLFHDGAEISYHFDETSGTNILDDSYKHVNNGTVVGNPNLNFSGVYGSGIDLDGSGDYIDTNYNIDLSSDLTLGFWVNFDSNPSTNVRLLGVYDGSQNIRVMHWYASDTLTFDMTAGGVRIIVEDAATNIDDANAHFVLATKNGNSDTGLKIYVDCVDESDSNPFTGTLSSPGAFTKSLYFGDENSNGAPAGDEIDGSVDEFFIIPRAISQQECIDKMNSGSAGAVRFKAGALSYTDTSIEDSQTQGDVLVTWMRNYTAMAGENKIGEAYEFNRLWAYQNYIHTLFRLKLDSGVNASNNFIRFPSTAQKAGALGKGKTYAVGSDYAAWVNESTWRDGVAGIDSVETQKINDSYTVTDGEITELIKDGDYSSAPFQSTAGTYSWNWIKFFDGQPADGYNPAQSYWARYSNPLNSSPTASVSNDTIEVFNGSVGVPVNASNLFLPLNCQNLLYSRAVRFYADPTRDFINYDLRVEMPSSRTNECKDVSVTDLSYKALVPSSVNSYISRYFNPYNNSVVSCNLLQTERVVKKFGENIDVISGSDVLCSGSAEGKQKIADWATLNSDKVLNYTIDEDFWRCEVTYFKVPDASSRCEVNYYQKQPQYNVEKVGTRCVVHINTNITRGAKGAFLLRHGAIDGSTTTAEQTTFNNDQSPLCVNCPDSFKSVFAQFVESSRPCFASAVSLGVDGTRNDNKYLIDSLEDRNISMYIDESDVLTDIVDVNLYMSTPALVGIKNGSGVYVPVASNVYNYTYSVNLSKGNSSSFAIAYNGFTSYFDVFVKSKPSQTQRSSNIFFFYGSGYPRDVTMGKKYEMWFSKTKIVADTNSTCEINYRFIQPKVQKLVSDYKLSTGDINIWGSADFDLSLTDGVHDVTDDVYGLFKNDKNLENLLGDDLKTDTRFNISVEYTGFCDGSPSSKYSIVKHGYYYYTPGCFEASGIYSFCPQYFAWGGKWFWPMILFAIIFFIRLTK